MSYDPSLGTDLDWVRRLIGDVDTVELLPNATITAVLAEEPNKWYAAARCGEMVFAKWQKAGGGLVEKKVGDLVLRRGEGSTSSQAYLEYLERLRVRGAEALSEAAGLPYSFRML